MNVIKSRNYSTTCLKIFPESKTDEKHNGISACVCVCVCTYVYVCVCMCIYIYIYIYICLTCPNINPLNPELNPICYLLALLGAHHFLHVSRIRVKLLTLGRLMSYIYTGWNRRNVPDFGRVFLMLEYTDITQNTYIQS